METQTDVTGLSSGVQEVSRSVAGAVAVATLGVVAGFGSVFAVNPLVTVLEAEWVLLGELVRSYSVQPGFGLLVAGYIWWRDDYNPLERIQVPSS